MQEPANSKEAGIPMTQPKDLENLNVSQPVRTSSQVISATEVENQVAIGI